MHHAPAIQRLAVQTVGIIACGLLGALAARWLILPTGGPSPGILEVQSAGGAVAILLVLLIATALAAGVARFTNAAVGLFSLGAALFVLSRRGGSVIELAFAGGGLWMVAVETLLWAGLILAATVVVFRVAGPLRDIEPDEMGRTPSPFLSREALLSAAMGVLVLPLVWFIAQSPDKGQAIAAVFMGSLFAGMAGRLVSPHVQPMLLFAAPCVIGAIGHVVGILITGGDAETAVTTRTLLTLNVPMPLDYAAGSLLGVSMGLGWAWSMLHHEDHPESGSNH